MRSAARAALPPDAARSLDSLLWGGQRAAPPSWQQGFFFSQQPGLKYGLVQLQGGPCGVLAAVQGAFSTANVALPLRCCRLNVQLCYFLCCFSQQPGLKYGLVQLQGGPCGVLAAVQGACLEGGAALPL